MVTRQRAAQDIAIVLAAIAAGWLLTKYFLYPALRVPDNAPMILRPIAGFAAATFLLWGAGERWRDYGLARPKSIVRAILVAIALYAVVSLAFQFVVPVLAGTLGAPAPSGPPFFAYIRGHPVALAGWIGIAWVVGAFIEEMLFRGYLIARIEQVAGGGPQALAAGIVGQAILFGMLHYYQGAFGAVSAGTFALIYGIAYIANGRNLWPLVVVHGTLNTVSFVALYTA